ncbi:MAG: DUF1801 domain-containing protein [Polyangiaceae bacterium]
MKTAAAQLDTFLAEYTTEIARQAKAAIAKLEKRFPGAHRLIYDNYNALVVTFGTTPTPKGIVCSLALYPKWVTLFFLRGSTLPDPKKLLVGSGKTIRSIVLKDEESLDEPDVVALLEWAFVDTPSVRDKKPRGELAIQSISPKRRPRRPPEKAEKKTAKKSASAKSPATTKPPATPRKPTTPRKPAAKKATGKTPAAKKPTAKATKTAR